MKALVVSEEHTADVIDIEDRPVEPNYLKVKTVALALNPTDFQHVDFVSPPGGIIGTDLSGIVEEVGPECTRSQQVKKGDRVIGVALCCVGRHEHGADTELAHVKDGHLCKLPDHMSFEDGASFGAGITTVGHALYYELKLPFPPATVKEPTSILIYGGSTATGTLAIQFAKLSGLTVLTTASPKNFDLVRSRGADEVFDYHDAQCGEKIRQHTQNTLRYVLDCISTKSSFEITAKALTSKSSAWELHMLSLLPPEGWPRDDVNARWMLAYTSFGEPFSKFGADWPVKEDHYDFGCKFWALAGQYIASGKIKPHPIEVRDGGFEKLAEGIDDLRHSRVSGKKLVYRVGEA